MEGRYRCRVALVRAATDDDLDAAFRLADARRTDAGTPGPEREEFARSWAGSETWVAEENGGLIGFVALSSGAPNRAGRRFTQVASPAAGDALLERAEAHARGSDTGCVLTTIESTDRAVAALLERRGFTRTNEILRMWRPLGVEHDAAWPAGAVARTYRDGDDAPVHALLDDAYAGWDGTYEREPHDRWIAEMTGDRQFDPELWFVVERNGDIVACCLNWAPNAGDGWVKDLAVREGERGHGVGSALLQHTFAGYARRGARRVGLKVDAANPSGALRLYNRAGFRTDCRYEIWTKRL